MDFDLFVKKYGADYIQSRTNPMTVSLSKLSDKKYRDREKIFLAEGVKLTEEALRYAQNECVIFSRSSVESNPAADRIALLASEKQVRIIVFADSAFEKISTEKAPQGIIAVVKYLSDIHVSDNFSEWQNSKRLLMLDEIRDPGNLGTILRSAEALGINGVVLASCADIYGNKTVRSAMGTLFRLPLYITSNGAECADLMRSFGRRVFSAALGEHTLTLGEYEPLESDCVIIGNEGHGVSHEILEKSDACVKIPMAGNTESLNASAAAACILWEYFRAFK
ncbi:MAG: RNA methyltransferase [Ruminococcaceae bacterium]|nr:RNA methyltransferase [Oscillospiraceae bacterium]